MTTLTTNWKIVASVSLISISLASFHPAFAVPVLEISELDVETVISGLSKPVTIDFLGPNDFLVLQKNNGQVLRVVNDVLQPNPVLDLSVANAIGVTRTTCGS